MDIWKDEDGWVLNPVGVRGHFIHCLVITVSPFPPTLRFGRQGGAMWTNIDFRSIIMSALRALNQLPENNVTPSGFSGPTVIVLL